MSTALDRWAHHEDTLDLHELVTEALTMLRHGLDRF